MDDDDGFRKTRQIGNKKTIGQEASNFSRFENHVWEFGIWVGRFLKLYLVNLLSS